MKGYKPNRQTTFNRLFSRTICISTRKVKWIKSGF